MEQVKENKRIIFAKTNALGNDFVLIKLDGKHEDVKNLPIFQKHNIIKIANRKFGIGADQILAIDSDFNINIWNQDGSVAKMCGNGLRSFAKWMFHEKELFGIKYDEITLNTISGRVYLAKYFDDGQEKIKLKMPKKAEITECEDAYIVNIGNMHKINIVASNPSNFADYADNNYNVSCIWLENGVCNARTWELGTGETFACGSAAFSIASVLDSMGQENLDIYFQQGVIKHLKNDNEIIQIGPAQIIAYGEFFPEFFEDIF